MKNKISVFRIFLLTSVLFLTLAFAIQSVYSSGAPPKTEKITSRYLDKLDGELAKKFVLYFPQDELITTKPTVMIKGVNRFLTAVFINEKKIAIRKDGRFLYNLKLPKIGKHLIVISFITPDNQVIHLTRKVVRLYRAPKEGINKRLRQQDMYFFNTEFVPNRKIPVLIKGYVTRAELAYYIAKLKGFAPDKKKKRVFRDVPSNHWAAPAIRYVTFEEYMAPFPDGKFKPNRAVKRIEYIITLVKAMGLDIHTKSDPVPYKDVNPRHWTYKYIKTAYTAKLIPKSLKLNMHSKLNHFSFAFLAKRITAVSTAIQREKSFATDFEIALAEENQILDSIESYIKQKSDEEYAKRRIKWKSPRDHEIVVRKRVDFEGSIYPAQEFKVNGKKIVPTVEGNFKFSMPVHRGRNNFNIEAFKKRQEKRVWHLQSYQDLTNHWFEKKAAELKFARILEDKRMFYPNRLVTRVYFAQVVSDIFDLKPKNNEKMPFTDVIRKDQDYRVIKAVYDHNILKGGGGFFRPNAIMTKIEGLAAIIRLCDFPKLSSAQNKKINLPYQDIKRYRWARNLIKHGYHNKIISPSKMLYPGKDMTKVELMSLIYKTPKVKAKLKRAFR